MEELEVEETTDEPAAVEPTAEQMEEGARVVSSGRSRGTTNRSGAGRDKDPGSDKQGSTGIKANMNRTQEANTETKGAKA